MAVAASRDILDTQLRRGLYIDPQRARKLPTGGDLVCRNPRLLYFFTALMLCATSQAAADEPNPLPSGKSGLAAPTNIAAALQAPIFSLSPGAQKAMEAWTGAVTDKPKLVTLLDDSRDDSLDGILKGRLKMLGNKRFSNREWKTFWDLQQKHAQAVLAALKAEKNPSDVIRKRLLAMQEGANAWATLAKDKSANQDVYLQAIDEEKNAIEDRLEALLDGPPPADKAKRTGLADLPNPYEKRQLELNDLEHRSEQQKKKRQNAEGETKFIERQLDSEGILLKALNRDLELAKREAEIAAVQASGDGLASWVAIWKTIRENAQDKVTKIGLEAQHGAARQRSRQVELVLSRAQIEFRDEKIAKLNADYIEASSWNGWVQATLETLIMWLRDNAWRILLGLTLIYLAARVALRIITKVTIVLLSRAEGDPDDDSDDDQRTRTLATVFSSIARTAVYLVGTLLALEQVGIDTGPVLGSVAILGLAVSFGSQNLVRDVVNGFFILLENQFAVGEVVTISGMTGTVERISIRSTWIRQSNGNLHVLPNGEVKTVSNLTRDWSKALCHIGISYDADLEQVETVVNQVGAEMAAEEEWAEQLEEAPSWVGVTELGDSAVVIRTQARVTPGNQWSVTRELNRRLKVAFDREGIEIPYPQRVVINKSAS